MRRPRWPGNSRRRKIVWDIIVTFKNRKTSNKVIFIIIVVVCWSTVVNGSVELIAYYHR